MALCLWALAVFLAPGLLDSTRPIPGSLDRSVQHVVTTGGKVASSTRRAQAIVPSVVGNFAPALPSAVRFFEAHALPLNSVDRFAHSAIAPPRSGDVFVSLSNPIRPQSHAGFLLPV